MKLLLLAGLLKAPTREQIGDKGLAALVVCAEKLLRAGLQPDANFLSGLQDYELEALCQASDRLAADRAAYAAAAMQGLKQAALAASHVDGGAALEAVADAEEIAKNRAEADRLIQQQIGENSLTRAPTRIVAIDKVTGLPEVAQ